MPGVVVHGDFLHIGLDALKRQLGTHAVGIREILVGAGLQHIGAAARLGNGFDVGLHVLVLLRHHYLEFRQHFVEGVGLRFVGRRVAGLGWLIAVIFLLDRLLGGGSRRIK